MVRAQHPVRVGAAGLGGELRGVDDVAPVRGEFEAVGRLGRAAARFAELAGDPADLHHWQARSVREQDGDLKDHAELAADAGLGAGGEPLGAVTGLEQEAPAGRHTGEGAAQSHDLVGQDQRRLEGQGVLHPLQGLGVGPVGLLCGGQGAPGSRCPGTGGPGPGTGGRPRGGRSGRRQAGDGHPISSLITAPGCSARMRSSPTRTAFTPARSSARASSAPRTPLSPTMTGPVPVRSARSARAAGPTASGRSGSPAGHGG